MLRNIFNKKETNIFPVSGMYGARKFVCEIIYNDERKNRRFKFGEMLKDLVIMPGMKRTNVLGKICDHMTPQGIAYYDGYFFATAYCGKKVHNSVIYVIDAKTEKYITTLVREKISHSGGITFAGDYMCVCDGPKYELTYYKYEQIKEKINDDVRFINLNEVDNGVVSIDNRASYCTTYKDYICVGTFDEGENSENRIIFYKLQDKELVNVKEIKDLPLKTQGVTFGQLNGKEYMIISASYGRFNRPQNYSRIYVYELTGDIVEGGNMSLVNTIIMPPMLEEVVVHENILYCVFESCASKYRKGGASPVISNICGFGFEFIVKGE